MGQVQSEGVVDHESRKQTIIGIRLEREARSNDDG